MIPSSLAAQLAASQPGPKVSTADQSSYFVRLGDLSPGFRQRAFEHALSHLQHSQFQVRDALAQLEDSFRLVSLPLPGGRLLLNISPWLPHLRVVICHLGDSVHGPLRWPRSAVTGLVSQRGTSRPNTRVSP